MGVVNQRSGKPNDPILITGQTRVVGVWGHPVAHSRSPVMQNAAIRALGLNWIYVPFDVDPENISSAVNGVRALGLVGVNATVPLKECLLEHLDVIDPRASLIGSVNTVNNIDGVLHGYSTDGPGFLRAIEALGWPVREQSVCILGAGGSARAVAFELAGLGNRITIANRSTDRAEALISAVNAAYTGSAFSMPLDARENLEDFDLVINTTSVGMSAGECPLPADRVLRPTSRVYDLIYAPEETELLRRARANGCVTSNGLGMLVQQGALSLSIWTGLSIGDMPIAIMERAAVANSYY